MKKRILGILITLVMLIGMLPTAVFAEGTTPYDLSVGGVQVTDANKANIVVPGATGSATYDPETCTLTLDNFSCSSDAFGGVINIQDGDITIKLKGNNTLSSTGEYTHGIYTNGNLAICNGEDGVAQGQLTINTVNACIGAPSGTLEITDVKVTATSTEEYGLSAKSISLSGVTLSATGGWEPIHTESVYLMDPETGEFVFDPETGRPVEVYGAINIENSTVEAYCTDTVWGDYAFDSTPNISGTFAVYAGDDAASALKVDSPTDATYANKYVRIEPVKYDLYIGGVQVTDANKANIVVPGATGSATYDPETCTLTLNNFSYTGEGRETEYYNAAISTDSINLKVKLVGTNTIICQSDDESVKCRAICVWYSLDSSAGHLTIYGTDKETDKLICTANDGISSVRSITVEDATVQTNGAPIISRVSNLTITDSIVSADLEAGDITLENSVLEISETAYAGDNFTITNSTVTGGGLSAFDNASTLTVTGSQVNVTGISACGFIIKGNSNVTAQAILVDRALIVTDSSVHVTGCELPELGLEGSFGILLLRSDGVVAIDNSTVEVYGGNGAYLNTDDFLTFTPFAPSFIDGEEPADPYDYTVYAGESAPGQCADASDVNTYANKYVKIGPVVMITKIEKTSTEGLVDTYTITYTDGTTTTLTVTNGTNGTDGKDGTNGKDGKTPYIGENGNWWIGDTDTGVKAAGDDGKDGAIIAATAVGGTALISNIALIAWTLIKKKRLF